MKYIAILALGLSLGGCAGIGDAIINKTDKATTAGVEAAKVVEHARCNYRTVAVLAKMIAEKGTAWAVGYGLSCPNLKPLLDLTIPKVGVDLIP